MTELHVIRDLAKKVTEDIIGAIARTVVLLAPDHVAMLSVANCAASGAIVPIAQILQQLKGLNQADAVFIAAEMIVIQVRSEADGDMEMLIADFQARLRVRGLDPDKYRVRPLTMEVR